MAKNIFTNQTTNAVSSQFLTSGQIQINISGVLDGADVMTYILGANGIKTPLRTCSWQSSQGDSFLPNETADAGVGILIEIDKIYFEIKNAGALTNISLDFYGEYYS